MSKTLLVTGGAGFIGSNFILYWMKQYPEDKIINLDALTYAGNLENLTDVVNNPNYTFVQGSICDAEIVNGLMKEATMVVHFAAESHVDRSIKNPQIFLDTNIMGTYTLVEAAIKNSIQHFHHISTDEVFGSLVLGTKTKFSEETKYDPRSPYSASKASSDHLVRAYGETYGLPYTITNCSNNYGEFHFPEKLIPLTITNLMEGKKVPVYGDGQQLRDWLYVQDHCRAIEAVVNSGKKQKTYLVGGLPQEVPNIDIIRMIIEIMGKDESQIEFVKDRPGHDVRYSVDWSRINRELGWEPSVSLEDGLRQTVQWYENNQAWWKPLKENQAAYFSEQYNQKI